MTDRLKKSIVPMLAAFLVVLALGGGGICFYLQNQSPDYVITFGDSKGISSGDKVILSGVEIGKVVSVKPSGTGVAVGIKAASDYQGNLTEASRFFIDAKEAPPRLLVKNLRASAKPLAPEQIAEGTDSSLQWNVYDYAKSMNRFFETGNFQPTREAVHGRVDEMDRQFSRMNWDKLGNDLHDQMEAFSRDLDEAINDQDIEDFQKELNRKVADALAALDRVQNSQEALELRKSIENFQRKVLKQLAPPETAAAKPATAI